MDRKETRELAGWLGALWKALTQASGRPKRELRPLAVDLEPKTASEAVALALGLVIGVLALAWLVLRPVEKPREPAPIPAAPPSKPRPAWVPPPEPKPDKPERDLPLVLPPSDGKEGGAANP